MSTLKKYAYGLLLTTIGLINFGYCDYINGLNYVGNIQSDGSSVYSHTFGFIGFPDVDSLFCVYVKNGSSLFYSLSIGNNNIRLRRSSFGCFEYGAGSQDVSIRISDANNNNLGVNFDFDVYSLPIDFVINSGSPFYTSLQCQTEYNLIPVSSVDQNYCVNNGLCPSGGGGECTGTGNWSALYINNIQYNGAPTIRVTIPEEIERDNYTDEEETTIDIIGYGYDQEKMQQMVNTQYYKPTADEMSGLMEKIADFLPLVAVALLITRLRRVIKKVF